jgi:hypothetical protein
MKRVLVLATLLLPTLAHANDYEDNQVEMETRQFYSDMERNHQHEEIMNELRMQRMQRGVINGGCDWCAPHR